MDTLWECKCGHHEYSDLDPEECSNCFEIGKFTQLPQELMDERQRDHDEEGELELTLSQKAKPSKVKVKTTKVKVTKSTKSKGKKK